MVEKVPETLYERRGPWCVFRDPATYCPKEGNERRTLKEEKREEGKKKTEKRESDRMFILTLKRGILWEVEREERLCEE